MSFVFPYIDVYGACGVLFLFLQDSDYFWFFTLFALTNVQKMHFFVLVFKKANI